MSDAPRSSSPNLTSRSTDGLRKGWTYDGSGGTRPKEYDPLNPEHRKTYGGKVVYFQRLLYSRERTEYDGPREAWELLGMRLATDRERAEQGLDGA